MIQRVQETKSDVILNLSLQKELQAKRWSKQSVCFPLSCNTYYCTHARNTLVLSPPGVGIVLPI